MDGARFDQWTRRRVGMATGSVLASLVGLALRDDAEAKNTHKRRHHRNNKNKKPKCRKLGQSCDQTQTKKQCCSAKQLCAQVEHLGNGNFCCKQGGDSCSVNDDCCGTDKCTNGKCVTP